MATSLAGAQIMLNKAKHKATELWTVSAGLYREMASSALQLVSGRR